MHVVDANVVLSALRSRNGASHIILREMLVGTVPFAVSPAVALEYEAVLKRPGILGDRAWITRDEIDVILDAILKQATLVSPWFRFRPFLLDPGDDLHVECALAASAATIVTSDRHFNAPEVGAFGMSVVKAGEFLADLRRRRQPT
jgi:predicted nucleic acid-binding protein